MTAKEFTKESLILHKGDWLKQMVKFAQYHVEQALKEVSKRVELMAIEAKWELSEDAEEPFDYVSDDLGNITTVNKKSILNAYPLENIK